MKINEKAESGANRNGSQNRRITGSDLSDFQIDINPNVEKLQSEIFQHLIRHKTVRRLVRCFGCDKAKAQNKMSNHSGLCRDCVKSLKMKGPTAQSNFIERVKSNIGRSLRRVACNV
jgi:hypothetical protein